ncbi:caspase family protein [Lysobacter brunescens]|uniref:Caspase family protein n=1 Tax=Lysobacter brunescens TaxID=262323 RepID=A0ABW2Y9S0_9GAMM
MADASDRIFVSIGVSKPGGGLDPLPGAIKAAERMAGWATAQGYDTVLIHDQAHAEVTVDLLRDAIASAIERVTDTTELKRLVVFFAGHGAAMAVGDQYWILTHWKKRPTEAIKVSSLQRMLEYYGPRQVAIIGDACQEFSAKFIDIVGSPVLDMPDEDQRPYELDQFFAVDTAKQAFMIKAVDGKEDFCLFTEVLLDALEGDATSTALEQVDGHWAVTSQSLARHLDRVVSKEAGKYGVRMIPRPKPGFYTDCIYLKMPPPDIDAVHRPPHDSHGIGVPPQMPSPRPRSVERVTLARPKPSQPGTETPDDALADSREAQRRAFRDEVESVTVRDHFETGCGLCVSGADVVSVVAAYGEVSRVDGPPNWFRVRLGEESNSLASSDCLVTLDNGHTHAVCMVQGFVAALHVLDERSASLFHRPLRAASHEGHFAIDLLARAHAGLLSPEEIVDAAAFLRHGKHRVITLGCIAAQFYDVIRDAWSLRSMASFYAQHGQPVPLDIVLYGGGRISESDGRLFADIPGVPARQPRTPEEARQGFAYEATPGFEQHPIAGRIPWMRHAWGAIATASCDASAEAWRSQALAAMAHLGPGAFTHVAADGRDALAVLAGGDAMPEREMALATC